MLAEAKEKLREQLKIRIPDTSDGICEEALSDAEGAILDICNRVSIKPQMYNVVLALAEVFARRIMAAGEVSRSEGDISITTAYTKDVPKDLEKRILAYRKLKQAGIAYETKI